MFENTFKNVDDILHKDAGCGSELDYVEQSSWVLFLKYLDDLEVEREIKAKLAGKDYKSLFDSEFQWRNWAVPKGEDGKIDFDEAKTGDDLTQFVNSKLFPYLAGFKLTATSPNTLEYKVGEIFSEVKNRIQNGYNLRDVLNMIDGLKFQTVEELHEMSFLYENKIKNMGNAGRNGGEYYTPRPLIKAIIEVVGPKVGDTIYDGAVGSAGFLCEAFNFLLQSKKLTAQDIEILQTKTLFGKEKKSLAYVIGVMNMILHGIDAPNIIHTNTLAENLGDIQEKDRFDVVLANPPFGGKERKEVQQNFPIKTGETAYLFMQHFMKMLRANGKAGIVIKNTFLSNVDNAAISIRKELLDNFNLHTVLDCPAGTFTGAGVKTVVLFFTKGEPTSKIWYYQLDPKRNMGKTNPLNDRDVAEFVALSKTKQDSELSWTIDVSDLDPKTYDLTPKNPNRPEADGLRTADEVLDEIVQLNTSANEIIGKLKSVLAEEFQNMGNKYSWGSLSDIAEVIAGQSPTGDNYNSDGIGMPFYQGKKEFGDMYLGEPTTWTKSVSKVAKSGDVLMSVRAPVGPVNVTKFECCIGRGLAAIRPRDGKATTEFLYFYLHSIEKLLVGKEGTVFASINKAQIQEIEIPIVPVNEQHAMVARIQAALSEIETIANLGRQTLQLLDEISGSIFKQALIGDSSASK
jgi:type I restriction enzyme M protein